jgi:hypothetical protein
MIRGFCGREMFLKGNQSYGKLLLQLCCSMGAENFFLENIFISSRCFPQSFDINQIKLLN